jgi:hypothetical protein
MKLEPLQTLDCSDLRLLTEGYPVEQGVEFEIPLLPPGSWAGQGVWLRLSGGALPPIP